MSHISKKEMNVNYNNKLEGSADIHNFNLKKYLEPIKIYAKNEYLVNDLHGLGHIKRVLEHSKRIVNKLLERDENLNVNWDLLEILIWLHDIGRKYESIYNYTKPHAQISAEMATKYLKQLGFPNVIINLIKSGILSHSFSLGVSASYLEAQILSDADKLDALGAIGIFRCIAYQVEIGKGLKSVIDHFHNKLLSLDKKLYLSISKEIAKVRIERLKKYELDLKDEYPDLF